MQNVNIMPSELGKRLIAAAKNGKEGDIVDIIKEIEESCGQNTELKKACLDEADGRGFTALKWATTQGYEKAVRLLCEAGADPNKANETGRTALMSAADGGYDYIVDYLLGVQGIKPNLKDIDDNTALMVAETEEIESLFLKVKGIDRNGYERVKLIQRARHGRTSEVKTLLKSRADVNVRDSLKFTPLIAAARGGHDAVVDTLLAEEKIEVNAQTYRGRTALMWAVVSSKVAIVKLLLKADGIDVNRRDFSNVTALEEAITSRSNSQEITQALLDHENIKVNDKMSGGESALKLALDAEYEDIALKIIMHEHFLFDGCLPAESDDIQRFIRDLDTQKWFRLLEGNSKKAFSLLSLMANGVTEESENPFWKYFKDEKLKHLIPNKDEDDDDDDAGEMNGLGKDGQNNADDNEGNTLFHHCVISQDTAGSIGVLKILPKEAFRNLHKVKNRGDKDTMLHLAMMHERPDIFHAIMDRFNTYEYSSLAHLWLSKILVEPNADENTIFAIAIKSGMGDEVILGMMKRMYDRQMRDVWNQTDADGNTVLHLAAKFARNKLIEYFANKPVDMAKSNIHGLTPLHVAVLNDRCETVEDMHRFFKDRGLKINERTKDKETALHIAAKNGNVKMMKLLVDLGGDLGAQDNDGHTPLHDVLQLLQLDGENKEFFQKVWTTVVDSSVTWWCLKPRSQKDSNSSQELVKFSAESFGTWKNKKSLPDKDSERYLRLRREAMYRLRSELRNNDDFTVLEYAATLGLSECVQIMLTERDVFVYHRRHFDKIECDEEFSYFVEVSNLTPEYQLEKTTVEKGPAKKIANSGVTGTEKLQSRGQHVSDRNITILSSFIDTLSEVHPPVKVNSILEQFPIRELVTQQWRIYQRIVFLFLMVHLGVMAGYMYVSQTSLQQNQSTNGTSASETIGYHTTDLFILAYALVIFFPYLGIYLYEGVKDIQKGNMSKKRKSENSTIEETKRKVPAENLTLRLKERMKRWYRSFQIWKNEYFADYIETKGSILNFLTYVVAFSAESFSFLTALVFMVTAAVQVAWSFTSNREAYAITKGLSLLSGWFFLLIIGKVYSPIFNFITALKYVFIKDIVPFLLFYLFLVVAFGCAIQLQFQLLSEETVEEFGTSWFVNFLTSSPLVIMELFIMIVGLDTDIKSLQTVGDIFSEENKGSFFTIFLLVMYSLACVIILLNMLIGGVSTTYSQVLEKQGKGWRQYQVSLALILRERTGGCLDGRAQLPSKARHENKGLWYVGISKEDLKKIKANYWKTVSEGLDNNKNNSVSTENSDESQDKVARDKERQETTKPANITTIESEIPPLVTMRKKSTKRLTTSIRKSNLKQLEDKNESTDL